MAKAGFVVMLVQLDFAALACGEIGCQHLPLMVQDISHRE